MGSRDYYDDKAPEDQSEWSYQQLLEREQWEADQAALAEYESWYLAKTIAEQDAEEIAEQ